jgi:hypothetical protein
MAGSKDRDRDVEEVETPTEEESKGQIYPYADLEGGTTKYAYGGEGGEEATYEEWAEQSGIALPEEVVDAEDDGA